MHICRWNNITIRDIITNEIWDNRIFWKIVLVFDQIIENHIIKFFSNLRLENVDFNE